MLDLQKLISTFPDLSTEASQGAISVLRLKNDSSLLAVLQLLKSDPQYQFNMLLDIVSVDYAAKRDLRFELVYVLYSTTKNVRLLLKLAVSEQKPMVPSAHQIWKSANWAEREVFDMMGIKFLGHPNLKRILLFEGFEGHPLRKDYPVNQRQKIPDVLEIP